MTLGYLSVKKELERYAEEYVELGTEQQRFLFDRKVEYFMEKNSWYNHSLLETFQKMYVDFKEQKIINTPSDSPEIW